jgi:hypothetical protein
MIEYLSIPTEQLCRILSGQQGTLNQFELAIRIALTRANTEDELEAIIEKACITSALSHVQVTSKGKVLKI